MPRSRQALDLVTAPREGFPALQGLVDGDGFSGWSSVTGSVNGILVTQLGKPLSKGGRVLKELTLPLGNRNLSYLAIDLPHALALLAMVVGKQYPLDPFHPELFQMRQGFAVAQVDQQGSVSVTNEVAIAGVGEGKELGKTLRVGLLKLLSEKRSAKNSKRKERKSLEVEWLSCAHGKSRLIFLAMVRLDPLVIVIGGLGGKESYQVS